ncbi:hypothetical protein [Fusobacterium polymorphum]|jgi:hypothetical protein|uniref:hypothetical protein n=1 Tax=Fusobacterium nucleatum subsp. polymorphum TaxID=76857 RepID=UPI0030D00A98
MKKYFILLFFFSILFNLSLFSYSLQKQEKNIFYIQNIESFYTLDTKENSISEEILNSSHLKIESEKDSLKTTNDNVKFAQSILNLFSFFSVIIPLLIVSSLIIIFYLKIVCKIIKKFSEALNLENLNIYILWFHLLLVPINYIIALFLMVNSILPLNLNITFLYYLSFIFKNIFKLDNKSSFISSAIITIFLTIMSLGIFNLTYFLDLIKILPNLKMPFNFV